MTPDADRELVEVGALCLKAYSGVLGVVNAQITDGLQAGESAAFQTTGPPTQVQPDTCTSTLIESTSQDVEF